MRRINIAIDGYSSCGKSTLAKALARELVYLYIDSGAMYRAVTLFAYRQGLFEAVGLNKNALLTELAEIEIGFHHRSDNGRSETLLNGENVEQAIRTMEVSERVSEVSTLPEVRQKLVTQQQQLGKDKGVVMDGRDIGTVVFPEAELKLFMTADPEVRAQRRFRELEAKGQTVSLEEVRQNLEKRDYIDTHRRADPLRQADDARVLDNSELTPQQQLELALSWVREVQMENAS